MSRINYSWGLIILPRSALDAVGNTPLVTLKKLLPTGAAEVWLKLEGGNPTGSYEDQMGASVLTDDLFRYVALPTHLVLLFRVQISRTLSITLDQFSGCTS